MVRIATISKTEPYEESNAETIPDNTQCLLHVTRRSCKRSTKWL